MKRLLKALFFVFSFLAVLKLSDVSCVKAEEATKNIPGKVRAYYGSCYIDVTLANYDDTIENLKVDKKNVPIKLISINKTEDINDGEKQSSKNEQSIGLYLKEYGTYTVSFDIIGKDGKKTSSETIKVYCYENPFTLKMDGKEIYNYIRLKEKSGKIQVSAAKGNTIKKLEYGVVKETTEGSVEEKDYYQDVELTYKTFKSGSKIVFNTIPDTYEEYNENTYDNHSYRSHRIRTSFIAYTSFKITYKDKYTGNIEEYTFEVSRVID